MTEDRPRRILIHAGFHKTGTSTVQDFLKANRETLRPYFLYYGKADFRALGALARELIAAKAFADGDIARARTGEHVKPDRPQQQVSQDRRQAQPCAIGRSDAQNRKGAHRHWHRPHRNPDLCRNRKKRDPHDHQSRPLGPQGHPLARTENVCKNRVRC